MQEDQWINQKNDTYTVEQYLIQGWDWFRFKNQTNYTAENWCTYHSHKPNHPPGATRTCAVTSITGVTYIFIYNHNYSICLNIESLNLCHTSN